MSKYLLGILGFVIVFSTVVGGMVVAGSLHELLTRNLDIFYVIWLWITLIPFFWIAYRTVGAERLEHPVAIYLASLPALLLLNAILQMLDVYSWASPFQDIAYIAFLFCALVGAEKVGSALGRRRKPPST